MIRLDFGVSIVLEGPQAVEKSPCRGALVHAKEHAERGLDDIRIGRVKLTR